MALDIRTAYGKALALYAEQHPEVVVLDADVSASTKTNAFAAKYPDRFYNVGIAESGMVSIAAGMAAVGLTPFANTFACFLTSNGLLAATSYGSYSELNLKLVGAYGGISDAFDGPSHHSVNDVAIMRSLPNFKVFVPSDEHQAAWLVKHAMEVKGPMYLRLSRDTFPEVYSESEDFAEGKAKVLAEGADAVIFANGLMVSKALSAREILAEEGIDAAVVDLFSVKPIDREAILRYAGKAKAVVTAEEHSILGGLHSAVSEVLTEAGAAKKVIPVGLADTHTECGPYKKILAKYGLDESAVVSAVKRALNDAD